MGTGHSGGEDEVWNVECMGIFNFFFFGFLILDGLDWIGADGGGGWGGMHLHLAHSITCFLSCIGSPGVGRDASKTEITQGGSTLTFTWSRGNTRNIHSFIPVENLSGGLLGIGSVRFMFR